MCFELRLPSIPSCHWGGAEDKFREILNWICAHLTSGGGAAFIVEHCDRWIGLYRKENGREEYEVYLWLRKGLAQIRLLDFVGAQQSLQNSYHHARCAESGAIFETLPNLALVFLETGNVLEAEACAQELLQVALLHGNKFSCGVAHVYLGHCSRTRAPAQALRHYRQALDVFRGDFENRAVWMASLTNIICFSYAYVGEVERSRARNEKSALGAIGVGIATYSHARVQNFRDLCIRIIEDSYISLGYTERAQKVREDAMSACGDFAQSKGYEMSTLGLDGVRCESVFDGVASDGPRWAIKLGYPHWQPRRSPRRSRGR